MTDKIDKLDSLISNLKDNQKKVVKINKMYNAIFLTSFWLLLFLLFATGLFIFSKALETLKGII